MEITKILVSNEQFVIYFNYCLFMWWATKYCFVCIVLLKFYGGMHLVSLHTST